jgi:hypothetical protein
LFCINILYYLIRDVKRAFWITSYLAEAIYRTPNLVAKIFFDRSLVEDPGPTFGDALKRVGAPIRAAAERNKLGTEDVGKESVYKLLKWRAPQPGEGQKGGFMIDSGRGRGHAYKGIIQMHMWPTQ